MSRCPVCGERLRIVMGQKAIARRYEVMGVLDELDKSRKGLASLTTDTKMNYKRDLLQHLTKMTDEGEAFLEPMHMYAHGRAPKARLLFRLWALHVERAIEQCLALRSQPVADYERRWKYTHEDGWKYGYGRLPAADGESWT